MNNVALSIRQPWASLIVLYGKDVENRNWMTARRGRVLIHAASKRCPRYEWRETIHFAQSVLGKFIHLDPTTIPYGGIIGGVEIVDCVRESESPWFCGPYGFVLRGAESLPFMPLRGQLGFFAVPDQEAP